MKTGETAKHHQIFDGYKKGSYTGFVGHTGLVGSTFVSA